MEILIIACGAFQAELENILPELCAKEFPQHTVTPVYLEMALHNDIEKLKRSVTQVLEENAGAKKPIVLFGSMCHPDMKELCQKYGAALPKDKDCIDLFVSDEDKARLAKGQEIFFLTNGWFTSWRDSLIGKGWDTYDARMNFGRYDSFVLLDTGLVEFSDETILDFFEFTTIPIETESIGLERLIQLVRGLILAAVGEVGASSGA